MVQKIRSNQTDFGSDTDAILVPKGTSVQASTVTAGALRYNTTTGQLEVADGSAYSGVGLEAPTLSSISPTNVNENVDGATVNFTVTGENFLSGITAVLVGTDASEVAFDSITRDSKTQLTCTLTVSNLDNTKEPYDIKVTNVGGLSTTLADQVNLNAAPAFQTAAGSLGVFEDNERSGINITIEATDPESAAGVELRILSGSIPPGLTFTDNGNSTATISGTADAVASDTVSNFTIEANDAASNSSTRAFSIQINVLKAETFTSPGTFSVPTGVSSVQLLVVGTGGTGTSGGGGAGGLLYTASYPVTPGGTVPVTVGAEHATIIPMPAPNNQAKGGPGQTSTFGPVVALSGGGGGNGGGQNNNQLPGQPGASGGGGGSSGSPSQTWPGGSATQGPSGGVTGYGNSGGSGLGNPAPFNPQRAGGGGGSNASGQPSGTATAGDAGLGGDGKSYTIEDGSTSVGYAGGGGSNPAQPEVFGARNPSTNPGPGPARPNSGAGHTSTPASAGIVVVRWA